MTRSGYDELACSDTWYLRMNRLILHRYYVFQKVAWAVSGQRVMARID